MLKAKTNTNLKAKSKQKMHRQNVKALRIVPWNFSPSICSFLKEKNYPSVLSAIPESLDRRGKERWYTIKSNLEKKEWEWYDYLLIHSTEIFNCILKLLNK